MIKQSKNVCVVGGGPAGLVTARELRKEGHKVVVIEQNHQIGGQWAYDPNVENEDPLANSNTFLKVHSSVYDSLRLVLPREMMGFSDFPFLEKKDRDARRYPGHREALLYLKDFAEFFGLSEFIRLNTRVERVGIADHDENDKEMKWTVKSKEKDSDDHLVEEIFDAVVIATGNSQPRLPSIKGMDAWRGKQLHCHVYRVPEPFRGEVVVVVGNSISGPDIAVELVGVAKQIYLVSKNLDVTEGLSKSISKHDTLHLRPQIDYLQEDGEVVFVDGSSVTANTIIYCTGYSYAMPFLDTKGIVTNDDGRIGPLYEHTFPPSLSPSLSFVGVASRIIPFPFYETQARWIAQVLSGERNLPSQDEMMKSVNELYHSRDIAGIPKHHTHDIGAFEYCDEYADHSGSAHLEEWKKEMYRRLFKNATENYETFRDSYDDHELIQEAHQSPQFIQLEAHYLSVNK